MVVLIVAQGGDLCTDYPPTACRSALFCAGFRYDPPGRCGTPDRPGRSVGNMVMLALSVFIVLAFVIFGPAPHGIPSSSNL
jgi:hypothetical protein